VLAVTFSGLILPAFVVRYDSQLRTEVVFRQLYKSGQWDALLEKAKETVSEDPQYQFMTNFALFQKQRLLEEMFKHPQAWGPRGLVFNFTCSGAADPADTDILRAMYNSDLFYEMGHINLAFRHAYDYMYAAGETYDVLERMTHCSLANDNPAMATKCLNVLEKTLFHRAFARRARAVIADRAAMEEEFGELRKRLPAVEHDIRYGPVMSISALLESNPGNRMAFDYGTAWLLLEKSNQSMVGICRAVEHFRKAGYVTLPTHCQEALLLWENLQRSPVELHGFGYDRETQVRVAGFLQLYVGYLNGREELQKLQEWYGDTYMFYYFFVTPPSLSGQSASASGGVGGAQRQE
jgi:hypothetical protein